MKLVKGDRVADASVGYAYYCCWPDEAVKRIFPNLTLSLTELFAVLRAADISML